MWSPDGERIAFESEVGGNRDLFIVRPDGSDLKAIAGAPGRDISPTWSRDGARLAFVSDRDGNEDVFVVNIDGSGLANISLGPVA